MATNNLRSIAKISIVKVPWIPNLFNIHYSFGPDSDELQQNLEELDGDLGNLIEKLEKANIEDDVNILITSDHGM